jgi:hypothetical protein
VRQHPRVNTLEIPARRRRPQPRVEVQRQETPRRVRRCGETGQAVEFAAGIEHLRRSARHVRVARRRVRRAWDSPIRHTRPPQRRSVPRVRRRPGRCRPGLAAARASCPSADSASDRRTGTTHRRAPELQTMLAADQATTRPTRAPRGRLARSKRRAELPSRLAPRSLTKCRLARPHRTLLGSLRPAHPDVMLQNRSKETMLSLADRCRHEV